MDDAKQQLTDKLKTANNILVTVSRDPTVDQLASCLGLALMLNKQGKHTAAVFSGNVPSTLEFLQPEDTLEKNTDSLRDFIIALDKSKADKLRYKVEDNVVRIFITPYKTSISEADLDFSQGDFNVDLVVALGVSRQEDLDEAIMAHGRILHDATVASINTSPDGGLGSINWQDSQASSLCELVTDLVRSLDPTLMDGQIATALLTGIVSETERFSNDKTSSQTMSISATLMAAGANQQLVASKLEEPAEPAIQEADGEEAEAQTSDSDEKQTDDGTIEIEHDHDKEEPVEAPALDLPAPDPEPPISEPILDEPAPNETFSGLSEGSKFVTAPPSLGGTLTANSQPEALDPVTDPMSMPSAEPPQLLERSLEPAAALTPPPLNWTPPTDDAPTPADTTPPPDPFIPPTDSITPPVDPPVTFIDDPNNPGPSLSDLEEQVKKEEEQAAADVKSEATGLNTARDEVDKALGTAASTLPPKPIEALNAQPFGGDLHPDEAPLTPTASPIQPDPATSDATSPITPKVDDPSAPPSVPPPIPFQFGNPNPPQQ